MVIYHYSKTTKEFLTRSTINENSPMFSNNVSKMKYTTTIKPPATNKNEVAVFDEENNLWKKLPDFRGVQYYDVNGSSTMITDINVVVPPQCTINTPPSNLQYYRLVGSVWTLKDIEILKQLKINELYSYVALLMESSISKYAPAERETWLRMYDECIQYRSDGTIGMLMSKKISTSPTHNTADKLADWTIDQYTSYIDVKFDLEAQRGQHKLNIQNLTTQQDVVDYDITCSI